MQMYPHMVMQIITFYFDYLWREVYAAQQSSVLFVGGAMTFLLSQLAGVGSSADAQQFGDHGGACSQLQLCPLQAQETSLALWHLCSFPPEV